MTASIITGIHGLANNAPAENKNYGGGPRSVKV
jgi:hypothetical protein